MTLQVTQTGGAGVMTAGDALESGWLGVNTTIALDDLPGATYTHAILDTSDGINASLSDPTSRVATLVTSAGTQPCGVVRCSHTYVHNGTTVTTILVHEFTKNAAGTLQQYGLPRIAKGEKTGERPGLTRGIASIMDRVIAGFQDAIAGASGLTLSNVDPQQLGAASAGVSTSASRADHVHEPIPDTASSADTLVQRDASGFAYVAKLVTSLVESAQAALTLKPAARSTAGAGYSVTIGGGAGNVPGTDLAGGCNVDLGRTVGGTSAKCAFLTNTGGASTERLTVECVSGTLRLWNLVDGTDLYAASNLGFRSSAAVSFGGTSVAVSSASLICQTAVGSTKLTFGIADACTLTFDSLVTSVVDAITKRAGTGANAGAARSITSQDGQNVAAGTNNNGGAFVTGSGAAGTGGTGGRAGHWDANVGGVLAQRLDGSDLSCQLTGAYLESAGQVSSQPGSYAYSATVTLDGTEGNHHEVGTMTGNITSLEHGGSLRPGSLHTVQVKMNGTGGYSITWDTEFKFGTLSDQPLGDANARTIWLFRVDSAGDIHCLSRNTYTS